MVATTPSTTTPATSRKATGTLRQPNAVLRFLLEVRANWPLFVMLLPGLVVLLVNNYMPMLGVIIAFKRYTNHGHYLLNIIKSEFVGLRNFEFFFKTPYAYQITRNTILYNAVFIVLGILIPVTLAIMLSETRNKFLAKLYQSAMFLPFFLSWVVVSYLAYSLLQTNLGFINTSILKPLGIEPVNWYFEPKYWPFILTIFQVWKFTGYNVVVYLASIAGIDSELYEAAALDGASKGQQIRYITLPHLQPIIIIMSLLAVGRIFNADFGLFYNVTRNSGALASVTNVVDVYVYNTLKNSSNIGMATAAGLYQAIVGCCTVFTANLIVRRIDKDKALF